MRIFLGDKSYESSFRCALLCLWPCLLPLQEGFHHIVVVLVFVSLFTLSWNAALKKNISIPKRKKKIQRKLLNKFFSVRHLLFGNDSDHTWVTYTPLDNRLGTMIGRFTTIGLEEDIPQREGLVSSKEIGWMCLPSKTNTCTRESCH